MFALLVLLRDNSNSFNLNNVAELLRNRTDTKGVQAEAENKKYIVIFSRSPQTSELVISRCWHAVVSGQCLAEHDKCSIWASDFFIDAAYRANDLEKNLKFLYFCVDFSFMVTSAWS